MRVLFLNPPFIDQFSRTGRRSAVTRGDTVYYPIWLAYAAGATEQAGHDVRLLDAPLDVVHFQGQPKAGELLGSLKNFIPDLVVMEIGAHSLFNDLEVAGLIKAQYPDVVMIVVGVYASAAYEKILELSDDVDAVAVGEYDYIIRNLVQALERDTPMNEVPGLVFRQGKEIVKTNGQSYINNLDDLPFVSSIYKQHLNYRNYFNPVAHYPVIMIVTSRGCPYKCFFCALPQVLHGHEYRARSPENVVSEFEFIVQNYSEIKEIGIEDDCFAIDKDRVAEICDLLIKKNIRIKWYCTARADLDYSLMKKMKKAGCRLISVGFENACQSILEAVHKDITIDRYHQFMEDARRAGILIQGCFMIGNPGETKETVYRSYRLATKINCDSIRFYPLYLYPGTKASHWAKTNNYVVEDVLSEWLREDSILPYVLNNPDLPPEKMVSISNYLEKKYYLRLRYLLGKFWQIIVYPSEGRYNIKRAKRFILRCINDQLHKCR